MPPHPGAGDDSDRDRQEFDMSDPQDWNAKTIAEFRATRAGSAGFSRALRWSWSITAAAGAGGSRSLR
jgi:hypothetical protein